MTVLLLFDVCLTMLGCRRAAGQPLSAQDNVVVYSAALLCTGAALSWTPALGAKVCSTSVETVIRTSHSVLRGNTLL